MKAIILILIIISTIWYNTSYLNENKPIWYVQLLSYIPAINTDASINFDEDMSNLSEQNIINLFDNLLISCKSEPSNLGERACFTYISKFNSIPANSIAFFFERGKYRGLRVSFPPDEHNSLLDYLKRISTSHRTVPESEKQHGQQLVMWFTKTGVLAALETRSRSGAESIMTWQSFKKLK